MPKQGEEHTEDLHDGRDLGDWQSRFGPRAWGQIILELTYLCFALALGIYFLIYGAAANSQVSCGEADTGIKLSHFLICSSTIHWFALAISGMLGGVVFALKWLYHSVANNIWHQDRILWRLIVPVNSMVVSLFTGFIFASGIIPFFRNESFDDLYTLLGFGFVFGYFSDNILAALQNVAQRIFGTLHSDD